MSTVQNVNKSRFGFHACNYDIFLKLKKLKKMYFKALYRNADWTRWSNKHPQNRVLRKWIRNDKGQRIGFNVIGPMEEPKVYPIFGGRHYVPQGEHALNDMGVLEAYNTARTPYITAEEVKPLKLTIEQINNMLAHLEKADNA